MVVFAVYPRNLHEGMCMSAKKYSDFVAAQSHINGIVNPKDLPFFTVIYGSSDYLVLKSCANIKKKFAQNCGGSFEATTVAVDTLVAMVESSAIFEPNPLYFIGKLEAKADFWKTLSSIKVSKVTDARFVLIYKGDSMPAKLLEELTRLGGFLIPCVEPAAAEMPRFIAALGKRHGIQLNAEACHLLRDTLGDDLLKLDNEISKLGMIFTNGGVMGANHIAPHLTLLREDHIFTIDSLLLQKKKAEAILLIHELLRRGENSLALLGVIANHCRKSLKILNLTKKRTPFPRMAELLHLPGHVIRSYTEYVSNIDMRTFIRALTSCAEADVKLKTSSQRDADITISKVLMELPD